MINAMRELIVHHHIFKNAGTTVDLILGRQFGTRLLPFEGAFNWSVVSPSALIEFIRAHPEILAITSHQARLVVQSDPHIQVHPIIMLRHPIDRVRSVYDFARRSSLAPGNIQSQAAHALNFKAYVEWHLERHYAVIRDYQTVFFAGRGKDMRSIDSSDADLTEAIRRLDSLPAFGMVEKFSESMKRFAAAYAHLGLTDVTYTPQNLSPGRLGDLQSRLDDIEMQLGKTTFAALTLANRRDMELHAYASEKFAAQT